MITNNSDSLRRRLVPLADEENNLRRFRGSSSDCLRFEVPILSENVAFGNRLVLLGIFAEEEWLSHQGSHRGLAIMLATG